MRVGVQNIGPFVEGGEMEIPVYKMQEGGREAERRNWVPRERCEGVFDGKWVDALVGCERREVGCEGGDALGG
jgi:hypothetical protein